MGLKSRLLRVLEFKLFTPDYRFARPFYRLADRFLRLLFSDLRKLDQLKDRLDVYAIVEARVTGRAEYWMRVFVNLVVAFAFVLILVLLTSFKSLPLALGGPLMMFVFVLTCIWIIVGTSTAMWLAMRREFQRELRWELFRRNADRGQCPEGLYPLTGLSSPRCPECGTRLDGSEG